MIEREGDKEREGEGESEREGEERGRERERAGARECRLNKETMTTARLPWQLLQGPESIIAHQSLSKKELHYKQKKRERIKKNTKTHMHTQTFF